MRKKGENMTFIPVHLIYCGCCGFSDKMRFETPVHLWIEPGLVFVVAILLRLLSGEERLSHWLAVVGVCLWFKEFLNYWYRLRHEKKQADIFKDAEEEIGGSPAMSQTGAPTGAGRKPREHRARSAESTQESEEERRHAERLRLTPPYSLQDAEQNFKMLIKNCHPDNNEQSIESNQQN